MLLDENLPSKLRRLFEAGVEVVTVGYRGWKGKENGELLKSAESEFDVLVTMDQGIPQQQNLSEIKMGIVLLEAKGNRYEDLEPLMNQVNTVLRTIEKGQVISVRA
ncbi:MAG: DUF5615 family PIN-like protein [Gemmatimonadota bacterium]|nr:DUF5615 family PIN-like protein [Gemmatimonadota bacterium]